MNRELSSKISNDLLRINSGELKWIYLGTKIDSGSYRLTKFDSITGIDPKNKTIYADSIFGYRIVIYSDAEEHNTLMQLMESDENEKITEFIESIVFKYLNSKDAIDIMKYKIDNAYKTGYENHKKDFMDIIGIKNY